MQMVPARNEPNPMCDNTIAASESQWALDTWATSIPTHESLHQNRTPPAATTDRVWDHGPGRDEPFGSRSAH